MKIRRPQSNWRREFSKRLRGRHLTLLLEPGRYLVADAGLLLTRVLYRKEAGAKHFIIVDAAMNDLARPALYDAYHGIHPLQIKKGHARDGRYRGAGLRVRRLSGAPANDDRCPPGWHGLAIATAGAYGFTMGSQYNSRPRPAGSPGARQTLDGDP